MRTLRQDLLSITVLFTIAVQPVPADGAAFRENPQARKRPWSSNGGKASFKKANDQYPPNNPYAAIAQTKIKDKEDYEVPSLLKPETDWTSEEEPIRENIDVFQNYQLEINDNVTKETPKPFYMKYGIDPPRSSSKQPQFKDFVQKYQPATVWEQIEKDQIYTGKNITLVKKMASLVNGIENTDELLSLPVQNGNAKLPVKINGRRFRVSTYTDQPPFGFDYMYVHQYIIELMKQAIYQARDRMTFMQNLRGRHRRSGLYKLGFLFAKADYAGKVFASVSQKAFRMCSMIRQGVYGIYRPFQHYLDIVYAIERMEAKWFETDLLADMIFINDDLVKNVIFRNRSLETPRQLAKAFDEMFIE